MEDGFTVTTEYENRAAQSSALLRHYKETPKLSPTGSRQPLYDSNSGADNVNPTSPSTISIAEIHTADSAHDC